MKKILTLIAGVAIVAACAPKEQPHSVIPQPNSMEIAEGEVNVAGAAFEIGEGLDELTLAAVKDFEARLETVTGRKAGSGKAVIAISKNEDLAPEQYAVAISEGKVVIEASALNGFLYGMETVKQMLPVEVYGSAKASAKWTVPFGFILDQPRFAYRGMHLDPCRHFWTIEETKRYIDLMAIYKMNRFHWHLTEDQGWRMESKKYPRLNEISSYRDGTCIKNDFESNDGIRYGGYYTQDELREIVAYAGSKGITVIPEIDLPGHMVAALAAYPELGCTGGPYKVWPRWGVSEDVLCIGKEETFEFLEGVLTELIDIFPSEYIHIGGDECPKVRWAECPLCQRRIKKLGLKDSDRATKEQQLQCYVTARIQKFLAKHGRKIIGWDEILEGDLEPGATVMSWRGVQGGIEAANRGFDAIMTPSPFLYFDYYQSWERDKEPFGIGGYLPIEKVYSYEPYDGLTPGLEGHILGVQANLWTEYIATEEHLEYMLLPRMCALSEVQWCDPEVRDYERFHTSLQKAYKMFDLMGYNYCLDGEGLIGLDRTPARSEEELEVYLKENEGKFW